MDGLIIKKKWLDFILAGEKTLEIRGNATKKTGEKIYLLESGSSLIRGIAIIENVIPITRSDWALQYKEHCVKDMSYEELLNIYTKPYFWKITVVEKFNTPTTYNHPKGAVIWVKNVSSK